MTYDPNDTRTGPRSPNDPRPEVVNHVDARSRGSSWMPWVAVLAVVLIAAFIWRNMGGEPGTDPATTSATDAPAVTNDAPAPVAPAAPAAPAAPTNDAAPAAPAGNGG